MAWIPEKLRPNSSWLSQLPLYEKGFALKAIEFRDGLALRYGYEIPDAPVFSSSFDDCYASLAIPRLLRSLIHSISLEIIVLLTTILILSQKTILR
jgi:hypothetical protein